MSPHLTLDRKTVGSNLSPFYLKRRERLVLKTKKSKRAKYNFKTRRLNIKMKSEM